jgi:hypothetical protein
MPWPHRVHGELINCSTFLRVSRTGYDGGRRDLAVLFLHLLATIARLAGPGGTRSVVAESVLLRAHNKTSPPHRLKGIDHMPEVLWTAMAVALLSDPLWDLVEPFLPIPARRPKGGRPRISDRACLTGILFVLRSGIP